MSQYRYKGIDRNGKYVNGKLVAENSSELSALLREKQIELISFKAERKGKGFGGSISTKDMIAMFVHLEQLDKAGISIIDSVSDLRDTSDSQKIKSLMHEVYESIKNGNLFSESLAKHPHIFSQVYIGLISTGEKTGNLSGCFVSIIEDLKWSMEMKRKVKKATMGPLFGLLVMFGVVGIMTTVVVPKVTDFLLSQKIELPIATTALIGFSNFVKKRWYIVISTPIIIFTIIKILKRSSELEVKMDMMMLKIPVIGAIINKIDAAKFCQFFSMTFKSGLGVLECLDSASSVIRNTAIKRSILVAKQQISDGKSLAESIKSSGYFPNLVVRMFKIGEDSGNMEEALQNIKFFYDREINDSIDRIIGLMQPTLTFVMGGMIAWIALAVFGPIYGSFSNMP